MNKMILLMMMFIFSSCAKDTLRIGMDCYIYDYITKKPISDVEIIQSQDGENNIITKTSLNGNFKVKELTKLKLGIESHKLSSLILLKKSGYLTDTIETYGNTNDFYRRDSIFLKKL